VAVDREVAAATFAQHLNELWASGRPDRAGWGRISLDPLHSAIALPATRSDGRRDHYFLFIGAEYYDPWPVTAVFADPSDWTEARAGSRWLPKITSAPFEFSLHPEYDYGGGRMGQLLCFTGTANYYMVSHSPSEDTVWRQGKETLSVTIARMAEALQHPYYEGPSG
jgi:hypothetical protein